MSESYKHIVDDTNGKSSQELKSDFLAEMCEQRLDGKAKLVTTDSNSLTYSFLERDNLSIEFENRDALLEELCQKVFGAKPIYKQ